MCEHTIEQVGFKSIPENSASRIWWSTISVLHRCITKFMTFLRLGLRLQLRSLQNIQEHRVNRVTPD